MSLSTKNSTGTAQIPSHDEQKPLHHPDTPHPPISLDKSHEFYDPHGYINVINFPTKFNKKKFREVFDKMPEVEIRDEVTGETRMEKLQCLDVEKPFRKKGLFMKFASPQHATMAKKMLLATKPDYMIDFRKARKWDVKTQRIREEQAMKRIKKMGESDTVRDIEDQVTPLAKLSYVEQLKSKQKDVINSMEKHFARKFCVKWITNTPYKEGSEGFDGSEGDQVPAYLQPHLEREIRRAPKHSNDEAMADDLLAGIEDLDTSNHLTQEQRQEITLHAVQHSKSLPYTYLPIVSSPQIYNYRNNCEFTCGLNQNKEKTVGFLHGSFADGHVTVASPANLKHIPFCAIDICERMDKLINQSPLECYDKTNHSGFWRMIKVRNNRDGDAIIMIQVSPDGVTTEQLESAKKLIVDGFTSSNDWHSQQNDKFEIKGVLWQEYNGVSNAAPEDCPVVCLHGEEHIYESILGKKFRISMKSFFQVNTLGAERLYSIAMKWASQNCEDALLLDVCCGTGTIGIIMSSQVQRVVGLEINADAVQDAHNNAAFNHVTNIEFVLGPAETTIQEVVTKYKNQFKNIVAIVDPPRAGLHKKVLETLLTTTAIEWIVYVSCKPGSLANDTTQLCVPPNRKVRSHLHGDEELMPFRPIKQVSVDMFPHTKHCENVMLLRRLQRNDMISKQPYISLYNKKLRGGK